MVYFSSSTEELLKQYIKIIGSEKMKILTEIAGELASGIAPDQTLYHFGIKN